MTDPRSEWVDREHLRLLALGYKISAAMTAVFALFGLLYVGIGLAIGVFAGASAQHPNQTTADAWVGMVLAVFGGVFVIGALLLALAKFYTAKFLEERTSRTFCLVIAGVCCLGIPYGTMLGVFTFIVLERPGVKTLFGLPAVPVAAPPPTLPPPPAATT